MEWDDVPKVNIEDWFGSRPVKETPDPTDDVFARDDAVYRAPADSLRATPPAGALVVYATDDPSLADAHPEYAWLILEPL